MNNQKIQTFKGVNILEKDILIALDDRNQAIRLELTSVDNHNSDDHKYFSICGSAFNLDDVFTEEEGEEKAQGYLDDGEDWRMAVESEITTLGMDDWNEQVLSNDGWENIVGDVEGVGEYNGRFYYCQHGSSGQIDVGTQFKSLLIKKEELDTIMKAWKELHIKSVVKFTKEQVDLANKVVDIFNKYPEFDNSQMAQFLPVVLNND